MSDFNDSKLENENDTVENEKSSSPFGDRQALNGNPEENSFKEPNFEEEPSEENSFKEPNFEEEPSEENSFKEPNFEEEPSEENSFKETRFDEKVGGDANFIQYNNGEYNNFGEPFRNSNGEGPHFEEPTVPPPKQGNGFWLLVASAMLIIGVFVAAIFAKYYTGVPTGNSSEDLPSHEYTSTIVEHIKIDNESKETYDNKTELYSDAEKSCVTVICVSEKSSYGQKYETVSLGSGFVVSKEGYIVTNAHVVSGGTSFKVRFYDGVEAPALLVGADSVCDLAVLKIKNVKELIPVSLGNSDNVRVGDFVMAIGTPSGEELYGTMTFGVISGKDRKIGMKNSQGQTVRTLSLLQTDATLNPGNSGGPLFNMQGQVIGINVMKLTDEFEGIGFAIPVKGAINIINSLISLGKADYSDSGYVKDGAQLGISGKTVTDQVKKDYNLPDKCPKGVLIVSINMGSSAYKAGLSTFDVICEFDGKSITNIEQLVALLEGKSPNDKVSVKVYRFERKTGEGKYITYDFTLDAVKE